MHDLLLGDTLMLSALLAALRERYPSSQIYITAPPALVPLFSGRPYGALVLPFDERSREALAALSPARHCDIAFIPGDNRHALTARALRARWIVAFADARPRWKNWVVDETVAFPAAPTALGDIFASLAGPAGRTRFVPGDWPAPAFAPFTRPTARYAVLHVGARSPLRYWPAQRWARLAAELVRRGFEVVWSAGAGETGLVEEIDPHQRFASYAGRLDLPQLWQLVNDAALLVTLDTGVAHLAKLTGTRAVCIFGPGSAPLLGRGQFWADAPFHAATVSDFPCRDQPFLFKREVPWVRHCARSTSECPRARCMETVSVEDVVAALPQ